MQGGQTDFIRLHFTSRAQHDRLQEQVAISTKVGRHILGNLGVSFSGSLNQYVSKSSTVVSVQRGANFHCWQEIPWSCLGYMVTKTEAPSFGTRVDSGYEPLAGQLASGCCF